MNDATLGAWYRHTAMFASPSVFEGFGIPPVEALDFGLPTLTTKCTAIPETTIGLAATVDDPFSVGEWAERMESIIRDPVQHRPIPSGAARLRRHYDPTQIARQYAKVCLA